MLLRAGTSGYSYTEWKGFFYPEKLPARAMLGFYAQHFGAVEINNTFYRMPLPEQLQAWAAQVPEAFRFAIKTPRRITHLRRLAGVEQETAQLIEALRALGPRLGVLLVQLPPDFAFDPTRFTAFVAQLPAALPLAFEFRHASWEAGAVRELLGTRAAAIVTTDADPETDAPAAPPRLDAHTRVGYLRLRRASYSPRELAAWARRIRAQPWDEAFVFFKHEREGPARALALLDAFARTQPARADTRTGG
jgi:uncharacterized protein YecE (DUF72 family)